MKHDHKKTKKLKVALFAMIMFLPFIAIGVTCATHIFNEEVAEETQTAEIEYKYQLATQLPTNRLAVETNKLYKLNTTPTNDEGFYVEYISDGINTISCENYWTIYVNVQQYEIHVNNIYFDINKTYIVMHTQDIEEPQFWENLGLGNNEGNMITNVDITTNPQDQTTNIFYDSCDQVQDSFVLNWCTNENPIRNGINAFTNAFNLPNEHMINTLLTYWLCISMIYIVIDIIIECIVYITHFFNKEV